MPLAQPTAPRLVFRSLTARDLASFHELVCEESVRRFLFDGQLMPLEWCAQAIDTASAEAARSGLGLWLLSEREGAQPVGFAGYFRFEGPDSPLQFLYAVRESHTGHGYGREAAVALIDFAREHCGQWDIVAAVNEKDVGSRKVLERVGFQEAGSVPGAYGHMLRYRLARGRAPIERRTGERSGCSGEFVTSGA